MLPVGKPQDHVSLTLGARFLMLFRPNQNKVPVSKSGSVDWSKVERVMILDIVSKK